MANINISFNQATDTFSIALDKWEWTALSVNNNNITPTSGGTKFQFNQTTPGVVHFVATANQYIDLVNAGNTLYLQGKNNTTYMCVISYQETANPKIITLHGVLVVVSVPIPDALEGPIGFSQGRMTGTFQTINETPSQMTSLVGTKWRLSMNQQGTPVTVNIKFYNNGKCSYGPYDNCTYTQTETTFILLNPHDSSQVTKVTASFDINGTGKGVLTNEFNHQPIGLKTPFILKKL